MALFNRHKASLDILWLRDESFEEPEDVVPQTLRKSLRI